MYIKHSKFTKQKITKAGMRRTSERERERRPERETQTDRQTEGVTEDE